MTEYERPSADLDETLGSDASAMGVGGTAAGNDPAQIQQEIERTRERMARDVDAIGEKLSPRNIAQGAVDSVSYQARETGTRVVDFIREHPLPVAAVGLGVTWLMTLRSSSNNPVSGDRMARYAYTGPERRGRGGMGQRVGEIAGSVREKASDTVSSVSDRASDLAERVSDRASDLADRTQSRVHDLGSQAREQASRARGKLDQLIDENPLAVAASAAILGLALGFLLPETQRENEALGPARDRLMERAGDAAERVKDVATETAQQVKDTVTTQMQDRGPELKQTLQEAAQPVVEQVKEAAGRAKDEAKDAVKSSKGSRGNRSGQ
jgi:ElaB/YqjD/DUF883 family membrane-anchored ribosome-binding protein